MRNKIGMDVRGICGVRASLPTTGAHRCVPSFGLVCEGSPFLSFSFSRRATQVIMAHPILDQAFEKHAQDYLCSESYDFIKEVREQLSYFSLFQTYVVHPPTNT